MSQPPDPHALADMVAEVDRRQADYDLAPAAGDPNASAKAWLIGGLAVAGLLLLMLPEGGGRRRR